MAEKTGAPMDTIAAQMQIIQAALSPQEIAAAGIDPNKIREAESQMNDAQANSEANRGPSTTGLGVLQSALTAKTDEYNRESNIGDTMAAAGITGYGALQSQMQAKQKELDTRISGLKDRLLTQGTKEADVAQLALDQYKVYAEDFNRQADRLYEVTAKIQDHERAIELYEEQKKLDLKYDELSGDNGPTPGQLLEGTEKGFVWNGDGWIDSSSVEGIFQRTTKSDYGWGIGKAECGEGSNDITDGTKVGDTWASKFQTVNKTKTVPEVGNQIQVPLSQYGHTMTTLGYNPSDETVSVVEWNRHGDGKMEFNNYSMADLTSKFGQVGKDWGFSDTKLKSQYADKYEQVRPDKTLSELPVVGKMLPKEIGDIRFNGGNKTSKLNVKELVKDASFMADLRNIITAVGANNETQKKSTISEYLNKKQSGLASEENISIVYNAL